MFDKENLSAGDDLHGACLEGEDISGVVLAGADISAASLSCANLSFADLSGANLSESDLSGADLSEANLSGADFTKSDLRGANLEGSDLSGAMFSGANLSGSNLRDADLSEADFSGADLSGADCCGTTLDKTDFSGANLLETGLELNNLYDAILSDTTLRDISEDEIADEEFIEEELEELYTYRNQHGDEGIFIRDDSEGWHSNDRRWEITHWYGRNGWEVRCDGEQWGNWEKDYNECPPRRKCVGFPSLAEAIMTIEHYLDNLDEDGNARDGVNWSGPLQTEEDWEAIEAVKAGSRQQKEKEKKLRRKRQSEMACKLNELNPNIVHRLEGFEIMVRYLDEGPVNIKVPGAEANWPDRGIIPLLNSANNCLDFLTRLANNKVGKKHFRQTVKKYLDSAQKKSSPAPQVETPDPLEIAFVMD